MGWFDERFAEKNGRIRFDCIVCGRGMWFPPSKHGKYTTCGGECGAGKRLIGVLARAKECKTCGRTFSPRQTQLDAGVGIYCSQKCNVSSHSAMNGDEAQKRAKASWRAKYDKTPFSKKGPLNAKWNGGRKATYKRQVASGRRRIHYHNRKNRNGFVKASPAIVIDLLESQRWTCVACRLKLVKYEVDHIKPVSKGGTNERTNLQILCKPCNRKKHAKDNVDFMQQNGFLL